MIQANKLLMLLFPLILLSCKRENVPDLSLPTITQTGQNTLGFYYNNKVWTNYGRRCTFAGCNDNRVSAEFFKQSNGDFILSVAAAYTVSSQIIDQYFGFTTTNITKTGIYALDSSQGHHILYVANRYSQSYKDYKNRVPNKFVLTITRFDTTSKIIAGTFNGVLYNRTDLSDSVLIQEGRFDAQLDYRR